jgi:alpha-galactosidase
LAIRNLLIAAASAMLVCAPAGAADTDPLAPTGQWTLPERQQARTPPMGWNSWNAFRTEVDEEKVLGAARTIVDSGLAKLGYVYINIDDGWWLKRRTRDGKMQIRTAIFPSAKVKGSDSSFRPFTDKLHAMGLKAGIYTDVGRNACSQAYDLHSPNLPEGSTAEREVGLYGHVEQDIALYFRDWGFDYIKVDACGLNVYGPDAPIIQQHGYRPFPPLIDQTSLARTDMPSVRRLYEEVAEALDEFNPDGDYILAICNWGTANVRAWGKQVGHLWRTSGDITPKWTRMLHTFDSASTRALYAKPGAWNDPDMLFVGHGDFDVNHLVEARSHFSLWAIINAPLLIGYDLRNAPQSLLDIWGNADAVRINQDPLGNQAVIAYASDDVQILVKTLSTGAKAVAVFNRGQGRQEVNLTAAHLKFAVDAPIKLRDLWEKKDLAPFTSEMTFTLEPRQTLLFEARGERRLKGGVYLSEMPADVNVAVDGVLLPELDPVVHRMAGPWSGTRDTGERPAYAGWGGAQPDATPYDQALQIGGRRFDTGIGILAGSRLEVRNAGGYKKFAALVGVDDSTRNAADKVEFLVYGDGKLLARSGELKFGDAAKPLEANIEAAKVVELVVRQSTRAGGLPVVVTWADAALGAG